MGRSGLARRYRADDPDRLGKKAKFESYAISKADPRYQANLEDLRAQLVSAING